MLPCSAAAGAGMALDYPGTGELASPCPVSQPASSRERLWRSEPPPGGTTCPHPAQSVRRLKQQRRYVKWGHVVKNSRSELNEPSKLLLLLLALIFLLLRRLDVGLCRLFNTFFTWGGDEVRTRNTKLRLFLTHLYFSELTKDFHSDICPSCTQCLIMTRFALGV